MNHQKIEADPWAVGWLIRGIVVAAFVTAFAVPLSWLPIITAAREGSNSTDPGNGVVIIPLSTPLPAGTMTPEIIATPTPHVTRIGIIAGHAGSDSGAVCPDGLQEVDINTDIARRVVGLLRQRGWQIDLLEEFDDALTDYTADALISIHSDSCTVPGKSGFKVARAESNHTMGPDDRLVACLSLHYEKLTGLAFDAHTITYDMTRYHAYYEIDRNTPAAIIETGFMLDDRELLTQRPDAAAKGIADGIVCFIEGDEMQ